MTVRNLRSRMGLDVLLEAVASMKQREPEVRLSIVGVGPLFASLRETTERLGLTANVEFLGRVPDDELPGLYRQGDVSVLPSREREGLGLGLLEALASGVPTVGTPVGGIPEVIEGIHPGWIAKEAGAEAIASAALQAGKDTVEGSGRRRTGPMRKAFPGPRPKARWRRL